MALRVLLADESSTIKKVMMLALQDFGVEVKSVQVGVDVIDVCKDFKPDIIFVDVLLQKLNGYEVSYKIKHDDELKDLPVVLMWSSFMDLDEDKFSASGAEGRLEKPFDVEDLRAMVLSLVPNTKDQKLAPYLIFSPSLTSDFVEDEKKKAANPPNLPPEKPTVLTVEGGPEPEFSSDNSSELEDGPNDEPLDNMELKQTVEIERSSDEMQSIDLTGQNEVNFDEPLEEDAPPQQPSSRESDWSMEDFQSLEDFSENPITENFNDEDSDDSEEFQPINLSHMDDDGVTRTVQNIENDLGSVNPPENFEEQDQNQMFETQTPNDLSDGSNIDDDESWDQRSVEDFRIDFEDEDDDSFHVTNISGIDESDLQDENFLLNDEKSQNTGTSKPSRKPPKVSEDSIPGVPLSADDVLAPNSADEDLDDFDSAPQTHMIDLNELKNEGIESFDFSSMNDLPDSSSSTLETDSSESSLSLDIPQAKPSDSDDIATRLISDPAMRAVLESQIEKIVINQSLDIIESIVRRVLPEIATKVIKEELEKIMAEED